jgi:CHAD domain
MRMKNKIKRRLVKINAFLNSKKKPSLKIIHHLRLEVKHLEAFFELMKIQNNFGARSEIPDRLDKLFHEAGELRKLELETSVIESITNNNRLSKPTLFIEHLKFSKKKTSKKLCKKRNTYRAFKLRDFAKHSDSKLSSYTWQQFLAARASSMVDLFTQDIISDIQSLHRLRKILKSILYVLPLCKKKVKSVRVILKTRKRFIKSVESKIGTLHDTHFFVTSLEKNHNIIQSPEQDSLKRIRQVWQKDMMWMRKDLQPLLPAIRQFALDLKDQSTDYLNTARVVSI